MLKKELTRVTGHFHKLK